MHTNETTQEKLTQSLLTVYLVILTWGILFKMTFHIFYLIHMNFRSINLIPFHASPIVNGKVDISEILLNILAFVPLGIYVSMLRPTWPFFQKILPAFAISLSYEVLQYILAIGGSDITDLIGNTLGEIIGVGIYAILHRFLRQKTNRILNLLAAIATAALLLLLLLLTVANT